MTNQTISNPTGSNVEVKGVAKRVEAKKESVKAVNGKTKSKRNTMFSENPIVQGMVWHEILSGPLCKRRRNK